MEIEVDGENYPVVHDEMGRVRRTLDFVLEYDASNRLTEAYSLNTGESERYAYDAQGRLAYVYDSEQKITQHFGYDGARMVVAMDKNYSILWQSFQGPSLDLILEFHGQNQALMPIIDHRKSIAGAWDMENGVMVGIATYDEEGRLALYSNDEALECNEVGNPGVICSAPAGMPFGLNARWRSPLTGFVTMHHRWYSPRMGEFLSHDPLGYIDSYNLFGFATYDPINGYDPFGLETFQVTAMGDFINDDKSRSELNDLEEKIENGGSRLTSPAALRATQIRAEAYVRHRKAGNYFKAAANLGLAIMDSFAFVLYDKDSSSKTLRNVVVATVIGAGINKLFAASAAAGDASSAAGAGALKPTFTSRPPQNFVKSLKTRVSTQKQARHLKGKAPDGKSYLENINDAKSVLDAVHSGKAKWLGTNRAGHQIYRYNKITGTNVNAKHGVSEPEAWCF